MLRQELKDSDIPHRDTIRARITEILQEHFDHTHDEMTQVCILSQLHIYDIYIYIYIYIDL